MHILSCATETFARPPYTTVEEVEKDSNLQHTWQLNSCIIYS